MASIGSNLKSRAGGRHLEDTGAPLGGDPRQPLGWRRARARVGPMAVSTELAGMGGLAVVDPIPSHRSATSRDD